MSFTGPAVTGVATGSLAIHVAGLGLPVDMPWHVGTLRRWGRSTARSSAQTANFGEQVEGSGSHLLAWLGSCGLGRMRNYSDS